MKLKMFRNGVGYNVNLVEGVTISEEYNETLDSASVIISDVNKIPDLQPYDDIIICSDDKENYNGEWYRETERVSIALKAVEERTKPADNFIFLSWHNLPNQPIFPSIIIDSQKKEQYFVISGWGLSTWRHWFYDFDVQERNSNCDIDVDLSFDVTCSASLAVIEEMKIVSLSGYECADNQPAFLNLRGTVQTLSTSGSKTYYVYISCIYNENDNTIFIDKNQLVIGVNIYDNKDIISLGYINSIVVSTANNVTHSRFKIRDSYKKYTFTIKEPYLSNFFDVANPQEFSGKFIYNQNSTISETYLSTISFTLTGLQLTMSSDIFGSTTYNFVLNEDGTEASCIIELNNLGIDLLKIDEVYADMFDLFTILNNKPSFFKHFLVDNYQEELINITEKRYKYIIDLMSETKGLEKVMLPNIKITYNLNDPKTILYYLEKIVNRYSPKIKRVWNENNKEWKFVNQYQLSKQVIDIFANIFCPELALNSPNLKDVLTYLMQVNDMIPIVINGTIYCYDITERKGEFILDASVINSIMTSENSENYASALRKLYSNAISEESYARSIEYIGFRNKNVSTMTLGDIQLELRFPIYKIHKVNVCYYKQLTFLKNINGEVGTYQKIFLYKQDITPLILENKVRDTLPADWTNIPSTAPENIEELTQNKIFTLGYSQGSNIISGWGTQYSYVTGWWTEANFVYLEQILSWFHRFNPFGNYSIEYMNAFDYDAGRNINWSDTIITPDDFNSSGEKLKAVFFEVEYTGFYNGTVIISKDNGNVNENITVNDNASNSLTVLERDGIAQKEKINRIGNKTWKINARYTDLKQMENLNHVLGSVINNDALDNDLVIYSRQYQIYENYITATFVATKNYVQKNFFTSVWAKHRTYNLLSYDQSVTRSENEHRFIMLSKNQLYFNTEDDLKYINYNALLSIESLFMSPFTISPMVEKIGDIQKPNLINTAIMRVSIDDKNEYYLSDINMFQNGFSLGMNMAMFDNVSGGVYIDKDFLDTDYENDTKGTLQRWGLMVEDRYSGAIDDISFIFCHTNQKNIYFDEVVDYTIANENYIKEEIYDKLFLLPKMSEYVENNEELYNNIIRLDTNIYKDNAETIDFTLQYELVTYDNDIFISPMYLQLCDIVGNKLKVLNSYNVLSSEISGEPTIFNCYVYPIRQEGQMRILLRLTSDIFEELLNMQENEQHAMLQITIYVEGELYDDFYGNHFVKVYLYLEQVQSVSSTVLSVQCRFERFEAYKKYGEYHLLNQGYILLECKKQNYSTEQENIYPYDFICSNAFEALFDPNNPLDQYSWVRVNNDVRPKVFDEDEPGYNINDTNAALCDPSYIVLSSDYKTQEFVKTVYVYSSSNKLTKKVVYSQMPLNSIPDYMHEQNNFTNIFEINDDKYRKPKIRVNLSELTNKNDRSVSYWFYDEEKKMLRFVFGVNIDDEDWERGYIDIFVSITRKRNNKVFGFNNISNYIDHNYASDDDTLDYGMSNFYDEKEQE